MKKNFYKVLCILLCLYLLFCGYKFIRVTNVFDQIYYNERTDFGESKMSIGKFGSVVVQYGRRFPKEMMETEYGSKTTMIEIDYLGTGTSWEEVAFPPDKEHKLYQLIMEYIITYSSTDITPYETTIRIGYR